VLDETYSLLLSHGFGPIHTAYLQHLYKKNKEVGFRKDNRVFEAEVKTVLPSGRLVVQHAIEEEFDFGEVEWLIR